MLLLLFSDNTTTESYISMNEVDFVSVARSLDGYETQAALLPFCRHWAKRTGHCMMHCVSYGRL